MQGKEIVLLRREVQGLLVPSGANVKLPRGTEVSITQDLGGTYTIAVYGNLVRIDAKDADALGKIPSDPFADIDLENTSLEDLIQMQLKTCFDPEIPVNIIDLGLVYDIQTLPLGKNEFAISIQMTLTAPGCGMGPILADDVKIKLLKIPQVKQVEVELVFEPPWDRDRMSEAAKLQLGLL